MSDMGWMKMNIFEEVDYVKKAQPYLQTKHKEAKEKTGDDILQALRTLKLHVDQNTCAKIKQLDVIVVRTNQIVAGRATGFILMGIIISVFITGSITRPLTVMRKKTRQADIEIDGKKKELLKWPFCR